ncbi:amidohydrolase [Nisaea sp.]|uniref:amidohydrolase n=1 Tax=Nisaea sp. TaxID=2024842 RepID=UPI0032EEBA16
MILVLFGSIVRAAELRLFDTHIHYSHDAWEQYPPQDAVDILRQAGLSKAFVSSSPDDGTQRLYRLAPDLVVPVLRPYLKRGELHSWVDDPTILTMLAERLSTNRYAGIGEFHVSGADADKPAVRGLVDLARTHGLFLHAHADADAIVRIFNHDPAARVLWAHAGFEERARIEVMLETYPELRVDLSFRFEHVSGGAVTPAWRKTFLRFPERFTIGTDTYTPSRWLDVGDYLTWIRGWLADLPEPVRSNIAFRNAERLLESNPDAM